jgi:hypothetical protein
MKHTLYIILLLFSTSIFFGQEVDEKSMIGFACSVGGEQSETVKKFSILLAKKKYQRTVKFLNSKNVAEKALAAFVCEKLNGLKKITLTEEDLKRIKNIKESEDLVSVCSGCTQFEKIAIKNLFAQNEESKLYEGFLIEEHAKYWFEFYLKK